MSTSFRVINLFYTCVTEHCNEKWRRCDFAFDFFVGDSNENPST